MSSVAHSTRSVRDGHWSGLRPSATPGDLRRPSRPGACGSRRRCPACPGRFVSIWSQRATSGPGRAGARFGPCPMLGDDDERVGLQRQSRPRHRAPSLSPPAIDSQQQQQPSTYVTPVLTSSHTLSLSLSLSLSGSLLHSCYKIPLWLQRKRETCCSLGWVLL